VLIIKSHSPKPVVSIKIDATYALLHRSLPELKPIGEVNDET